MATFSLRATAPHQLNCKCWPTSWAALPPDLFRASVCSLCIYRLFCSCPQTALQICRNSKLVPRLQCGPWCITFSSVNPLTLTAILIWQEFGGILLNKKRTGSEGLWISSYIYCLDVCLLCCYFFFPLPMIKKKKKPASFTWPKSKARVVLTAQKSINILHEESSGTFIIFAWMILFWEEGTTLEQSLFQKVQALWNGLSNVTRSTDVHQAETHIMTDLFYVSTG